MHMQRNRPFPFQPNQGGSPFFSQYPNNHSQFTSYPQPHNQTPQQPSFPTPYQYFQKPQHPMEWYPEQTQSSFNTYGQQAKGFIQYFQDKDGQIDLDKMLNTVGKVANTYQQVTPLVKGIGSFVKGFK